MTYKLGAELYIAETLSRAALTEQGSDPEYEFEVFFPFFVYSSWNQLLRIRLAYNSLEKKQKV